MIISLNKLLKSQNQNFQLQRNLITKCLILVFLEASFINIWENQSIIWDPFISVRTKWSTHQNLFISCSPYSGHKHGTSQSNTDLPKSPLVVKTSQWQLFSFVSDMLNDSSQWIYCSWKLKNWILTCLGCSDTQDQGSACQCKGKQAKFNNSCQFETLYLFVVCLFINNVMICAHSLQYLFREPKLLVRFLG